MRTNTNHLRLFGLDLAGLFRRWHDGLAEALMRPTLHWLGLHEAVRVHTADGTVQCFKGYRPVACDGQALFTASLVPAHAVLIKEVSLPRMPNPALKSAMELEVESVTPFPPEETLWGFRRLDQDEDPSQKVILAISSRELVQKHMDPSHAAGLAQPDEVWGETAYGPVPFFGFNEHRRHKRENRNRQLAWATLAVMCSVLITLAAIPATVSYTQLKGAEAMYQNLRDETKPLINARDRLLRFQGLAQELGALHNGQPDYLAVLEKLSAVIPDGAWLERITWEGRTLQISGLADNGTTLLNILTQTESLGEARSTAPFTRDARLNKDRFSIEISLPPTIAGGSS